MFNYRGVSNNLCTSPFNDAIPGLSSLLSAEVTGQALSWGSKGGRHKNFMPKGNTDTFKIPSFYCMRSSFPHLPKQVEVTLKIDFILFHQRHRINIFLRLYRWHLVWKTHSAVHFILWNKSAEGTSTLRKSDTCLRDYLDPDYLDLTFWSLWCYSVLWLLDKIISSL